ncbi:MAG: DUF2330 domain-containing protein [Bacteroidia bacterium]
MKKSTIFLTLALLIGWQRLFAFCGFYVAKADATLFNKSSQVIIVRDGERTVITMASDFKGEVKDFAMVVPVPEVLQESDIRVVQQSIFDKLDAYTAPRLVEYWDPSPCPIVYKRMPMKMAESKSRMDDRTTSVGSTREEQLKVKIEAKYTVGEYDILILSAEESGGLKTWLTENGYKIPKNADEVLDPYIKEGMKFFVVKVNLEQQAALGEQNLRPLQIQFNSSRFMLPIRLGMANAKSDQDMIVYAFTKKGRVETANYRTTKLPTDRNIPEFIQTDGKFGDFYKAVFLRSWANQGRSTVMLEYAWDVSGQQAVKCDPCVTTPISYAELRESGVWWVNPNSMGGYTGDLFVTRLHVRYGRKTFPQDLMFLNTPDQDRYQARYVINHKAQGSLNCKEATAYKRKLRDRRAKELKELAALTGWDVSKWASYAMMDGEPDAQRSVATDGPKSPADTNLQVPFREGLPAYSVEDAPSDSGDAALGAVDESGPSEAERIEASDRFLGTAEASVGSGWGKRTWLFLFAGAMFVVGVGIRLVGRRRASN